ncbi:histone deacetylase 11 [Tribolium madens]|uniref:histone deacetylase 11 n=1 Tax=Tribolium madens TaxID=41895 RepID=UPI001CF75CA1|nr:histone deacetylase 11 [Tribolium madens]
MNTKLYIDIAPEQWPIIYRPEYNVRFLGLEKLHPFDAGKWGNIYKYLSSCGLISDETLSVPNEATNEDLLTVHTKKYLKSLKCSFNVALIAEVLPLCLVPNCLVQRGYLRPMRFQTGGSVLAGKLALERGWAINIGGGFHHCCGSKGGGFCVYADITLLIHFVFNHHPRSVQNVMIVDLDAHQGNGYQRDFKDNPNVYIIDVYNKGIYPFDKRAKEYITRKVELTHFTEDEEYLSKVAKNITEALAEFCPQLMVYNAGTDILKGDALGCLSVSPQGIIERDELVFREARSRNIPIVMLTSGGYLKKTAKIIATSIKNLHDSGLITGPQLRY